MKEKFRVILEKIIIIKINLFFIIIFGTAMVYSAEMLHNYNSIKELFFWIAILIIFSFQCFKPISRILDKIQEFITKVKQ